MARPGVALLLLCASIAALAVAVAGQQLSQNFEAIHPSLIGGKRNYAFACYDKKKPFKPRCHSICPNRCADYCLVFCPTCATYCPCDLKISGFVCGDPRFTGGDGNTFYFRGRKDANFCFVSESDLHINARFIGNHNADMNRNFTWVQALGMRFGDHRLYVGAQKTATWDDDVDHLTITFDGEPVYVPNEPNARWESTLLSFKVNLFIFLFVKLYIFLEISLFLFVKIYIFLKVSCNYHLLGLTFVW